MGENKNVRIARKVSEMYPNLTFYVLQKDRTKVYTNNLDDVPYWLNLGYEIIHVFVNGKEIFEC